MEGTWRTTRGPYVLAGGALVHPGVSLNTFYPLTCFFRYFKLVLFFLSSPTFYNTQVRFPTAQTSISQVILGNPHFKYFNKCIGAMDGLHIRVFSSTSDHDFMCNRKGYLSQNCLFACDFEFFFIYSLCGWDGSVVDSTLWRDAISNDIQVPSNRYLLSDAGFPSCDALLVPYQGVHYHL